MEEIERVAAAGIEESWQPDSLRMKLTSLEVGITWMAETIDELMDLADKVSADFAAYREKYPPTDDPS